MSYGVIPLFVYGTLLQPAIMQQVTGRMFPALAASLPGYQCYRLRNRTYTGIIEQANARVNGVVYQINQRALRLIDLYEDGCYQRQMLKVNTAKGPVLAHTHVIPSTRRHLLDYAKTPLVY